MPASSPLIVITAADPSRAVDPSLAERKNQLYAEAISRHGGTPVLLSPATPVTERDRLLRTMDGLLLSGGPDLDPTLYGGTPGGAKAPDTDRDRLDRVAWQAAEQRPLPVLGICRGMQAINVFSGGSLIQDVSSHAGTPYGQGEAEMHDLDVEPQSKLGRAIAAAAPDGLAAGDATDPLLELQVNTYHHQAIGAEQLAQTLRAVAWAPSEAGRLVEGFEGRGERWLVGIQCHPERTESTPEELEGLFTAFVRAAQSRAAG
jgi:gamma-glutamyl-gamma-aminobutyrate hydrolase PuuD